jgi:outer membrane beta-barrel protein
MPWDRFFVEKISQPAERSQVETGRRTNLAKSGAKRIRSTTLARASVALALALGLASGASARAAPPSGGTLENPFNSSAKEDGAGDEEARATAKTEKNKADDKAESARPAPPADKSTAAPDEPGRNASDTGASHDEGAESGDLGEGQGNDSATGDADAEGQGEDEPQSALHALTCLEGDGTGGGRRKGVQRRDFLKRHRFELSGLGGFYASDALSSTYSYGGALAYYPSEDFGVEVLVTRSPVRFRLEEPFTSFDQEHHFTPGIAWQGIVSLLWSPIHAKLKFSETTIVHSDIFVVGGAGRTFHESVLGLTWEAGLGIKLYVAHYVTLRFDVRDFLLPQEVLGRGRITNNVTVLGGVSVWIPG